MSPEIEMPQIKVKPQELHRLLGYPESYEINETVQQLIDWAGDWFFQNGKPWINKTEVGIDYDQNQQMRLDGISISGEELGKRFWQAKVDRSILIAASAGEAVDSEIKRLWKEGFPDRYYFLEMYATAVVEEIITSWAAAVCAEADRVGLAVLPRYSPGYSGWDLSCQKDLYRILDSKVPGFGQRISILPSGMLFPKKSQISLIGLAKQSSEFSTSTLESPCRTCSFSPCQFRREPYVANYQSRSESGNGVKSLTSLKYDFSETVLEKWSKNRLNVKPVEDGLVKVVFEMTGSTCKNMGWPLYFLFALTLKTVTRGYIVVDANASCTDEHKGYMKMCQYVRQGAGFMQTLAQPNNLKGKVLDELIREYRDTSPAGCLCNRVGRKYFWNIVLQTTHYYLYNERMRE